MAGHFKIFFIMEPTVNDLKELRRILSLGSTPYVEHLLGLEIKKLEEKFPDTPAQPEKAPEAPAKPKRIYETIDSYAFSDSDNVAKVIITKIRGLAQAEIEFEPNPHGFSVCIIREKQNLSNLKLTVQPTYKKIIPEESKYSVSNERLTISLQKKKKTSWMKLKKSAMDMKKKDDKSSKDKAKEDPNGALMDMMKKMYDEGDDEMKRTISKAMWEAQHKKPEDDKK